MSNSELSKKIEAGWDALGKGEMDRLAGMYVEDMIFVLPGQDDVLGIGIVKDVLNSSQSRQMFHGFIGTVSFVDCLLDQSCQTRE